MKTYRCPKCGEVIKVEDLVAVEDDGRNDAALLSAPPPTHLAVKTDNDDIWPVTTIRFKRISPLALFFIPFTCIWSGGSLTGIYGPQFMQHSFDLQRSLFGIPFLIGTAVLLSASLFMLFGKRVLTLSHGRGTYFTGVGFIGRTTRFAYGYGTKVEERGDIHGADDCHLKIVGCGDARLLLNPFDKVFSGSLGADCSCEFSNIETPEFFQALKWYEGPDTAEDYFERIIDLIKGTSVVGYVAAYDMTKVFDTIRLASYEVTAPLIVTIIVYAAIIQCVIVLMRRAIRSRWMADGH